MSVFRFRQVVTGVLVSVLAAGAIASAQPPSARETSGASVLSYSLTQQMPMDPEAVVGTLPNGLRYYVRANAKPGRRAELRLVVKAGSVLEDDDQQGLAHFVEHMEFEGTQHFPGQSITDFLSSLGLSIGPDANAATSFDDTQYTLRVPTDVPGVLDRALLVLEDWAHAAAFDQSGIDRERGIVLSEWRMHLGASERTQDKIRRVQLEGTRYADRPPIGKPDSIEQAQREQLTRFYRDWYRPDLMAVIVVGDVDRDAVVRLIKEHFTPLKSPAPRTRDEASLQAIVANDGVAKGLDALVTELQRVARFGFTATELARAKQAMMAGFERAVTESPDRESSSRADEYTRNFLEDEALPTIWQELAFHRRFVPGITLNEVNALANDWFPDRNRLVVVTAPEVTGAVVPDEAQLAAVVRTASSKRLERYVDSAAGQTLMDAPPARGTIVKTTNRPDGITEWTLSNGATVVLKPTTLRENQILFRAVAPGGTSLASDADFIPARIAGAVVTAGGVGKFSAVMLDKLLAGKAVAVSPFIDEISEGMEGGSTPQDLEAMAQLLYLRFTQPRRDPTAFAAMASQAGALLANRMASPDVVFNQTIEAILSGNSARRQPETPATVAQWNLDKSLAFYKARFADASNFTFVFVGSFTPDAIKPLVETYIASLPATHAHETWRDLGIAPPTGIVEKTVEQGIAPKSEVAIVFAGPFAYDDVHKLSLRTITLLLQSRLLDTIRQELGGTYSITVSPEMEKFPRPQYSVRIDWTCDPARTTALVQRVFEEIAFVRSTPLTADGVGGIREALQREFDRNIEENGYLLNQIVRRYEDREVEGATAIYDLRGQIAALTGDAIQQAAKTYLSASNYVKVVLNPGPK